MQLDGFIFVWISCWFMEDELVKVVLSHCFKNVWG